MPIEIMVNADDFWGIIDNLEGYPRRQVETIATAFQQLGAELAPILRANTPVGERGELARSTRAVVHILGQDVRLDVIQPAAAISDGALYQDYVAVGRAPGRRPPAEALEGWVQLKWGSTEPERDAFILARHIGQHGTRPDPYVINTLEQSQDIINDVARRLGIDLTIALWEDYQTRDLGL